MRRELNGAKPSVLWSGGGYHIHQPLETEVMPLYEGMREFKRYREPSVQFMRYAERVLTDGKSDNGHNTSFRSAMARIPGSKNTKYDGDKAQVRVIQVWDGIRARPRDQFIRSEFLIWLAQAEIDNKNKKYNKQPYKNNSNEHNNVLWIEKLLQTPIDDYRKHAIDIIIIPYLVVIKRVADASKIYNITMQWLEKCAELKRLEPSRHVFAARKRSRIYQVMQADSKGEAIAPMKWERLKKENPWLFKKLEPVRFG